VVDQVQVSGPISASVQQDSRERVAFDLMARIVGQEELDKAAPRSYFLSLYSQCLAVVRGSDPPKDIIERPRSRD